MKRGFQKENSPTSFLYINPYDTGSILKKSEKSALFGIPFAQNFLIGTFFRSKPRCKKIMNGGGVVQVGQKRAPQGLFYRNLHPPLEMWALIKTFFSSNEEHFFDIANFCKLKFFEISFDSFLRQKNDQKNHEIFMKKRLHRAPFLY